MHDNARLLQLGAKVIRSWTALVLLARSLGTCSVVMPARFLVSSSLTHSPRLQGVSSGSSTFRGQGSRGSM